MGRPRKPENSDLPAGVYRKGGALYEIRNGRWVRHEPSTGTGMAALLAQALRHKAKRIKPSTAAAYRSAAKKLSKALVEFEDPRDVTPRDVVQIRTALEDTPNMANACVSFLRITFDYALEERLVDSNPCVGIKRLEERKRKRCPTDAELNVVYEKSGPQLKIIIELLILAGQRIGDTLKIKRSDISEGGSCIRFRQQKTDERLVVRNIELRDVIARADALHGNVLALTLLHNRRGKAPCYRQIFDEWNAACLAAGVVDLHLHDLRAKAITALKKQAGKEAARALAGHTSDAQTERYIREHEEPVVTGPSFAGVLRPAK